MCERLSFVFCTFNLRAYFLFCLVFVGILKGVRVSLLLLLVVDFCFQLLIVLPELRLVYLRLLLG